MNIQDNITNALLLSSSFIENLGLFNGKTGIAIYFFHLARSTNNKLYEKYAEELIDEIYDEISLSTPLDFENGLAGIGWGIEYLAENGFIDADTNEVLEEFDDVLIKDVEDFKKSLRDIIGAGFYFHKRHHSSKNFEHVLVCIVVSYNRNKDSIITALKEEAVSSNTLGKNTIAFIESIWFLSELKLTCPYQKLADELLVYLILEVSKINNLIESSLFRFFFRGLLIKLLYQKTNGKELYIVLVNALKKVNPVGRTLLVMEVDLMKKNCSTIINLIVFTYKCLVRYTDDKSLQDEVEFWLNKNCTFLENGILRKIDLCNSTIQLGIMSGLAGIGLLCMNDSAKRNISV